MSSVTFVITVYNKSLFLKTAIKSIIKQTGSFKKEFIFINDGSTDNSLEILEKETKVLKNCRIVSQKNKGSANATNIGIKLAKMKYIKFLDADDVILKDSTNALVNILENNPKTILAYGLQRKVKDIKLVDLHEIFDQKNFSVINKPMNLAMRNSMFNPSQFLAKRQACQIVGGCDERIIFSQEYSLTLRLAKLGGFIRLNHPIAILPLEAPGQISEKKNNQIFRVSKALEFFIKENDDLNYFDKIFAQRRLTARAWRFSKKVAKVSFFSKWFLYYMIGFLRFPFFEKKICELSNKIYEDYLD
ncbi:MAG: glycosyltransferase family 2 protein [Alphaproteobacteria bacterium]